MTLNAIQLEEKLLVAPFRQHKTSLAIKCYFTYMMDFKRTSVPNPVFAGYWLRQLGPWSIVHEDDRLIAC